MTNPTHPSDPKSGANELRTRAKALLDALGAKDNHGDWDRQVEGRGWMKISEIAAELRPLLKREEVEAVGVLHPDGPECLENGQIVNVYPMHLAGPSDVLVYTSSPPQLPDAQQERDHLAMGKPDPQLLLALQSAAGIVRREGYANTGDALEILHSILAAEGEQDGD